MKNFSGKLQYLGVFLAAFLGAMAAIFIFKYYTSECDIMPSFKEMAEVSGNGNLDSSIGDEVIIDDEYISTNEFSSSNDNNNTQ